MVLRSQSYFFFSEENQEFLFTPTRLYFPRHINNLSNFNLLNSFYFFNSNFFSDTSFLMGNFKNLTNYREDYNSQTDAFAINSPTWEENLDFKIFAYMKNSTFISFFINNMVDVPVCFRKSFSLRNRNFELPVLKFFNFLMKKGKRTKVLALLLSDYRHSKEYEDNPKVDAFTLNGTWFSFFFLINTIFFDRINFKQFFFLFDQRTEIFDNCTVLNDDRIVEASTFSKNSLIPNIEQVSPVFSYFIYSVDKNVRKYSRGKSGKYIFIWKYVAPYKRIYIAMRWIVKEIKFRYERKFSDRFLSTLQVLQKSIDLSLAWKSKVFSHNYVFKNFKKSLMLNLKTIAK